MDLGCLLRLGNPWNKAQAAGATGQDGAGQRRAGAQLVEKLLQFDDQAVEIRWGQGAWQLWAGPVFLKDFGKKEQDARTAMHLIRELHLNARGRLGAPQAVAEYWLSNGSPSQTLRPMVLATLAFDPAEPERHASGRAVDAARARARLLSFANNEAEARRALAVFEHYHFDRVSLCWRADADLHVFSEQYRRHANEARRPGRFRPARIAITSAKPIHVVKPDAKPADPKEPEIDPRVGSQLVAAGPPTLAGEQYPRPGEPARTDSLQLAAGPLHQVGDIVGTGGSGCDHRPLRLG